MLGLLGLLGPGCQLGNEDLGGSSQQARAAASPVHDASSILVKFRNAPSAAALEDVLSRVGGKIQDRDGDHKDDRFANLADGRLAQIDLVGSMRATNALASLSNHPAIEYAEPNYIVHADVTPDDPSFGDLWGLQNTGQTGGTAGADISAPSAWDVTTGSADVVVGVIDTGIDYTHEDLADNVWINPNELPGNGVDDDGNGYIDDVHGINAITGTGDPMDDHDHGTHVSGTIGGVGNNGVGVAGVSWDVSLVGMKFLSSSGSGTTADAIKCIDYAVALKQSGVNIRVLSNSWGGGGFSQALEDAIVDANNADILFVAAAGNSTVDNDSSPHYPSSYEVANVLAVASTDHNDELSYFSNWGATSVDMGAPGSSILSTTIGNTYSSFSGTSMATPHVSGAAALLLSYNDILTVAELKDTLMNSGDAISALSGKTVSGKRLNVDSALAATAPPEPSFRLAVSPSSATVNQGESATYTIDVTSVLGYTGDVTLSLSATPALDATTTFTPNPVAVDSSATLTIDATTATATGDYTLTITGTSGDIVKTTTVTLTVRPEGTTEWTYTNTTPVDIPDDDPAGITSTIDVIDTMVIADTTVTVNITHTYIGDLIVKLTSPIGTEVVLHDRSGGSTDNLNQTYSVSAFNDENTYGTWTLSVSDNAGADLGTLDSWSLTFTGVPGGEPGNIPPTADFTADTSTGLTAAFTDTSTDADGTIAAWSWSFGDGATSTAQHPSHTYAADGTYTVSLTVTDDDGATSTTSQDITVWPDDTVTKTYSNTTPVDIPDNDPAGITSTIDVADSLTIYELSVTVNITHTYIGDLIVELTSPAGTTVTLHNRSGGSDDNLYQTYTPVEFNDENAAGTWTLSVSDNASYDLGTLDSWSMTITGADGGSSNSPPTAGFTSATSDLTATFTDTSTDADGAITAWSWDFGDGTTSTAQHPSHTYAAGGTYTVTLTVTDDAGATGTTAQSVTVTEPVSSIGLTVTGAEQKGRWYRVNLAWTDASTANVEIYRDGALIDTVADTGAYEDRVSTDAGTTFVYTVCDEGGQRCSNQETVSF